MKNLFKLWSLTIVLSLGTGEAFGQYAWTKDARNPVFSGVNGTWSTGVFSPCVLFNADSARYEMWFSACPGPTSDPNWNPYSVGFAVSNDGINWTMYPSPVLSPSPGAWDSFTIQGPEVLRENGQYKMWYSSYYNNLPSLPGYLGYATSPDGIHWTKYSGNPIFGPGTAAWEAAGPSGCTVVPKQGGYRMWFNGFNLTLTTVKIGYAESSDGINWIRDTVNNPILDVGSAGQWDDAGIGPGSVVTIDDSVYMWYTGNKAGVDGAQTGLAVSRDGITNWRKYSANPVLIRGGLGTWDNERAIAQTVLRVGDTLHMWYEGWRTPYTSYQYRIGHATSKVTVTMKHIIVFGGSVGLTYSPSSLSATVGDTIEWQGDFTVHPLSSTTIPAGALSWHNGTGTVFDYVVAVPGTYNYQCDVHSGVGMVGSFVVSITSVGNDQNFRLPASIRLLQNYPNPFNPSTTIKYELPKASEVKLSVYDLLGREVSVLVNVKRDAGVHEVRFDAAGLSSGVYFYRLQTGDFVQSKRLVILK